MEQNAAMERERLACRQTSTKRGPSWPALTIPRLAFGEQLTLWSARRVHASAQCDAASEADAASGRREVLARVGKELGVALRTAAAPDAGVEAARALDTTLSAFSRTGIRTLRLNPPSCRFVGGDERLFLSFLAGCQAGDHAHTSALLSWFFRPPAMRMAASRGGAFAFALARGGHWLPQRLRLAGCVGLTCAGAGFDPHRHRLH